MVCTSILLNLQMRNWRHGAKLPKVMSLLSDELGFAHQQSDSSTPTVLGAGNVTASKGNWACPREASVY